jgi:glycosyltransferase involved in cell wall biosynthesis
MKIIILSDKFSPGHIAHLQAYYQLSTECGFQVMLYLNEKYLDYIDINSYKIIKNLKELYDFNPDVVLIYNVSISSIKIAKICKQNNWKLIYIWHEPYPGWRQILKEKDYAFRFIGADIISLYISNQADKVFLASDYAIKNCYKYNYRIYRKSIKFPLIFENKSLKNNKFIIRKFFSHIGAFSEAHGSLEFLKFVRSAEGKKIYFQIATKTNIIKFLRDPILQRMIDKGQLIIQQGRPLSEQEINCAYQQSICIWNAYKRSTQSGVLPNAFMLGTPVISTNIGSFPEFVVPGITGEFIDIYDNEAIFKAYGKIKNNISDMEQACKKEFLSKFYYKNQINEFVKIIGDIKG